MTASILPPNATPLERALEAVGRARLDAIAIPVADVTRPHEAPPAFLPFLAFARSVDLWDRDWPEETKRAIVADAVRLHRLKGTLAGIRAHVAYTRGEIVDAVVPPQAFFAGGDDDALWEAWRASLDEIRIYTVRSTAAENGYATSRGADDEVLLPGAFLGEEATATPTMFAGADLVSEYATLVSGGVEIPIGMIRRPDPRWGRTGEVIDFTWPGPAGAALFCDDAGSADGHVDGAADLPGLVSVHLVEGATSARWNVCSAASGFIQDVVPERGVVSTDDGVAVYADTPWDLDFVDEVDPDGATYRSLRLMRGAADLLPPASFCDHDRLGMPAYTAELVLAVPETAGPAVVFADATPLDGFHVAGDPDLRALDFALDAIAAAASARDTILVDLDVPTRRSLAVRGFDALQLT